MGVRLARADMKLLAVVSGLLAGLIVYLVSLQTVRALRAHPLYYIASELRKAQGGGPVFLIWNPRDQPFRTIDPSGMVSSADSLVLPPGGWFMARWQR